MLMTPESITIVLPLPGPLLSPNHAVSTIRGRFAKAAAVRRYRRRAREAVEAEHIETAPWPAMSVAAAFFWKTNRKRDEDNAMGSLKSAYDGIVDAGLVIDDDYKHMHRKIPTFSVDRNWPRVMLTIQRENSDDFH